MDTPSFDLARVVAVLREQTGPDGPFSMRGLSKEAQQHRDTVSDIVAGRNKNPTVKVLAALAEAMGKDVSVFGVEFVTRSTVPTEDELRDALLDALPDMPRGSPGRRAQYLAESVAQSLQLPASRPTNGAVRSSPLGDLVEGAPPPAATN